MLYALGQFIYGFAIGLLVLNTIVGLVEFFSYIIRKVRK